MILQVPQNTGISSLAEQQLASQQRLCSMILVSYLCTSDADTLE
jgi:hypothetical protein